jgi:hypothetical protein
MEYIGDIAVLDKLHNTNARIVVTAGVGTIHLAVSGGLDAGFVQSRLEQLCKGIGGLAIEGKAGNMFSVREEIGDGSAINIVHTLQKRHGKYHGLAIAAASALSVEGRVASFSARYDVRG